MDKLSQIREFISLLYKSRIITNDDKDVLLKKCNSLSHAIKVKDIRAIRSVINEISKVIVGVAKSSN